MRIKKILSLAVALAMVLTVMPAAFATAQEKVIFDMSTLEFTGEIDGDKLGAYGMTVTGGKLPKLNEKDWKDGFWKGSSGGGSKTLTFFKDTGRSKDNQTYSVSFNNSADSAGADKVVVDFVLAARDTYDNEYGSLNFKDINGVTFAHLFIDLGKGKGEGFDAEHPELENLPNSRFEFGTGETQYLVERAEDSRDQVMNYIGKKFRIEAVKSDAGYTVTYSIEGDDGNLAPVGEPCLVETMNGFKSIEADYGGWTNPWAGFGLQDLKVTATIPDTIKEVVANYTAGDETVATETKSYDSTVAKDVTFPAKTVVFNDDIWTADEVTLTDSKNVPMTRAAHYSSESVGDVVNLGEDYYKVTGESVIANGDFAYDALNWTNRSGTADVVGSTAKESVNNKETNVLTISPKGKKDAAALGKIWKLEPGTYYVSFWAAGVASDSKGNIYASLLQGGEDLRGDPEKDDKDNIAKIVGNLYADVDYDLIKNWEANAEWVNYTAAVEATAENPYLGLTFSWMEKGLRLANIEVLPVEEYVPDNQVKYTITVTGGDAELDTITGKAMAGEVIKIAENQIKGRVGKDYYATKAQDVTIIAGQSDYSIEAALAATIIGFEPVNAVTVEGYDPILPAAVQPILDKDVEGLVPEALPVTWTDTKGAVADTGLTVDAAVVTAPRAFEPTAGMIVTSELIQEGIDGSDQKDAWNDAYRFPEVLNKFTAAFFVLYNADGDNHILLMSSADPAGENNAFSSSHAHIKISKDGIQIRDGKQGSEGTNTLQTVLPTVEGDAYEIIIDYDNSKYDVYARDIYTGETGIYTGAVSRTAGAVDGVSFIGNNSKYDLYGFTVFNCSVAAQLTNEAPAAANIKASLDYIKDGEDINTLVIKFTTDAVGKTVKIYANDRHNTLVDSIVVEEGKDIVLVPKNPNVTYTARLVDTNTGFMLGWDKAALAPMVINDIALNLDEYAAKDQMDRVDKAVEALNQMGLAYQFHGDNPDEIEDPEITGAWFVDARDDFITATIDKTPAEGETPEKIDVTLTMNDGLFANGFGFKVGIKAGELDGKVGVATLPEGVEDTVFQTVTVTDDGTVTVQAADGTVYTFSLDSVEIEFVATEMADADAADADAAVDFIPEL